MKRLCDLPAEDRLSWRVQALIRATGATVPSEERLLRVRRLLDVPLRAATPRWGWRAGPALGLLVGPLAEEALALRIEASVGRGNGRQVQLATAYLAHYPQGRYRKLARKALSGRAQ